MRPSERVAGRTLAVLTAAWAAGALGSPAAAQQAEEAAADTVFEYEREIFDYPEQGRRNPFRPIQALEQTAAGPNFQDLHLTGIIYNPRAGSVAIVLDRAADKRHRLREGQSIGSARVVEIRPDEVVFTVTGPGFERREVLRVTRRQQEGDVR